MLTRIAVGVAVLLLMVSPPGSSAQSTVDWDPRAGEVTRVELEELLARLEEASVAPGYSGRVRDQARAEAEFVRARLEDGDFQVGDRIALQVRGEPRLSDTLMVSTGRQIELPDIGAISLVGVLRSELEQHLTNELSRYLQNPSLRATAMIRIGVLGSVARQGFYTVPATALMDDVLMIAGGPAGRADVAGLTVERGGRVIWDGDSLQRAIRDGRTLDQLNLRAGDRVVMPERRVGFFEGGGGVVRTLLVTIPPILFLFLRR